MLRRPRLVVAAGIVVLMAAIAAFPGLFAGWFGHGDPRVCDLAVSNLGPSAGHPFGFDKQGCDVYANVIYGARASITVGVLVTLGCLVLALVLGTLAGYYGGFADAVISRLSEVFLGVPLLLGALVLLGVLRDRSVWTVSLVLIIFGWPTLTRVTRSTVLAVRDLEYVDAARALGARDLDLMRKHVVPNAIGPVLVLATTTVGGVIAAEASLTYLGIGLTSPAISWGLQLSAARNDFAAAPHLLLFPSAFLSVAVLGFMLLGDAVRDVLDRRT
ncbi:ABC transporter permease [Amycolatopsis sacchari]|uniref:ABC transporter permease n=1 Tax=Amycolatopsis sacchari TaxID=115433 RepID=UPI003EC15511